MKTETPKLEAQNLILTALKEAYFRRAKKEKIGSTKQLTEEINLLESAIKELIQQIKDDKEN
jgi:hypothetical protein